jgi:branched-chain amino acid transport system substrate-binding protein
MVKKKLLVIIVFALTILLLILLAKLYKPKEFVVVVAGDNTSENAAIGNSIFFGAEAAYNAFSKQLPKDFSLRISKSPDQGKEEIVEFTALQAVADPNVIAVIGHSSSGDTKKALEVYKAYEMPILMPVATNPELTSEQNGSHNVYRLVPKDTLQASTIAKFCNEKLKEMANNISLNKSRDTNLVRKISNGSPRVAIINTGKPYGVSLGKSLSEALSNEGIRAIKLDKNNSKNTWAKIVRDEDPSIVVFAGYYNEGAEIINELRLAGLNQTIILTDGCFPADIFKKIDSHVDGREIYVAFIAKDWNTNELAKPLIDLAKREDKIDTSFAPFAYDSFHIIHNAVSKILSSQENSVNLDRKILLEYLKKNRNYDHESYIAGPYSFGDSGDNVYGEHHMYKLANSKAAFAWEMVK